MESMQPPCCNSCGKMIFVVLWIFFKECLDRCYGANPDPEGGQASDQP